MPIQAPQWTDFLTCPVCCNEYDFIRAPVSLLCAHTVCKLCLLKLHRKQCPFDQMMSRIDIENLPINYALLQLVSSGIQHECEKSAIQQPSANAVGLLSEDFGYYLKAVKCIEEVALFLKPFPSGNSDGSNISVLSRPMQRKLVMLINCQLLEQEGRIRAMRAARSIGERSVTELIIQHQNPQQLSSNLWAAVRGRGCQFLGPAMQEEVLKLVLLALEDGCALSRKVLVMFVVQRLEPQFPQASKTSIGHVVQLLYRASCFIVSKRDGDSSLMRLKEEFRTYDALRREHDTQIVEIGTEAGLRIAPDQWSALLYGDTVHKSHMQSIIDKLQTPQSFGQSVQELVIAIQRTSDPGNLFPLRSHLEYLADIDITDENAARSWKDIHKALQACHIVVSGLVNFIQLHTTRKVAPDNSVGMVLGGVHNLRYKTGCCRDLDLITSKTCLRGVNCTYIPTEELSRTDGTIQQSSCHVNVKLNGETDSINSVYPHPSIVSTQDTKNWELLCNIAYDSTHSMDNSNKELFLKRGDFGKERNYTSCTSVTYDEGVCRNLMTSPRLIPPLRMATNNQSSSIQYYEPAAVESWLKLGSGSCTSPSFLKHESDNSVEGIQGMVSKEHGNDNKWFPVVATKSDNMKEEHEVGGVSDMMRELELRIEHELEESSHWSPNKLNTGKR